jgi:hypothetical protein
MIGGDDMVRLAMAAALLLAACVDKVSEEERACPCGDGRTCCFDVCMPEGDACAIEETIGLGGGTLAAPNGATLEIPFGALAEDTVIRMRSIELAEIEGITFLGGAVALEPDGLLLGEPAALTLPFELDRVPSGADPNDVRVHVTPAGQPLYMPTDSEVTATTMEASVGRLRTFVPAYSSDCAGWRGSASVDMCTGEAEVGGTLYGIQCPQEDVEPGDATIVSCSCLEDGVETRTVDGTCRYDLQVYRFACGYSCPALADISDAGFTPDAAPPI